MFDGTNRAKLLEKTRDERRVSPEAEERRRPLSAFLIGLLDRFANAKLIDEIGAIFLLPLRIETLNHRHAKRGSVQSWKQGSNRFLCGNALT